MYAPIILTLSVILYSVMISNIGKGAFFLFILFVISAFRILIFFFADAVPTYGSCEKYLLDSGIPYNTSSYSSFLILFTLAYLVTPMIILSRETEQNVVNYGIVLFYLAYFFLDTFTKKANGCYSAVSIGTAVMNGGRRLMRMGMRGGMGAATADMSSAINIPYVSDVVGGVALGVLVSGLMYNSPMRKYLFVDDNVDGEVCSQPSKQKFKCNVYKNGELLSSTTQ